MFMPMTALFIYKLNFDGDHALLFNLCYQIRTCHPSITAPGEIFTKRINNRDYIVGNIERKILRIK